MKPKKTVYGVMWKSWIGIMLMLIMILSILDEKIWEGKLSFWDILAFSSCVTAILMIVIICTVQLLSEYFDILIENYFDFEQRKIDSINKLFKD